MQSISWIFKLREEVPYFLENLKSREKSGFFSYSLSGNLYNENVKWGLGNTVFAVKIYYILNLMDKLPQKENKAIANFIKGFQKKNGAIYDPLIKRRSFYTDKLTCIKNRDVNNFFHQQTIRAETRQAISALKLLKEKPGVIFQDFPQTKRQIRKYLNKLNWRKPWAAGSHFSHLIFFLKNSGLKNKEILINFATDWVNRLQNPKDGFWYQGKPSLQQKINGAMKVISGLAITNKPPLKYPKKLIDLCLRARNNRQACDNFNVVYVLYQASRIARQDYRLGEIKKFALKRLQIYKGYYFPKEKGFSFLPHKANCYYYGAKISRGLKEPDIHGTCMFLGGISIIGRILGIDQDLNWKTLIL